MFDSAIVPIQILPWLNLSESGSVKQIRVLIVFYSFSGQTNNLLDSLSRGLEEGGIVVEWEQLKPISPPPFPAGSYLNALRMMVSAFFKKRIAIVPPDIRKSVVWDMIICAGPTWSYHPSGPMLAFLDNYAVEMFQGQLVQPVISCRCYWRLHLWEMKTALKGAGIRFLKPKVFPHPSPGVWCALGIFLKLAGKMPESCRSLFLTHCPRFGHSPQQIDAAKDIGRILANRLVEGSLKGEILE